MLVAGQRLVAILEVEPTLSPDFSFAVPNL